MTSDLQETSVLRATQGLQDPLERRVHKDRLEVQVLRVLLVLLEILVLLVPLVVLVLLVLLEPLERWVTQDPQVLKDRKETLVPQEQRVQLVTLDHKGLKGFRATLVQREPQVQQDHKA